MNGPLRSQNQKAVSKWQPPRQKRKHEANMAMFVDSRLFFRVTQAPGSSMTLTLDQDEIACNTSLFRRRPFFSHRTHVCRDSLLCQDCAGGWSWKPRKDENSPRIEGLCRRDSPDKHLEDLKGQLGASTWGVERNVSAQAEGEGVSRKASRLPQAAFRGGQHPGKWQRSGRAPGSPSPTAPNCEPESEASLVYWGPVASGMSVHGGALTG